jgi:PPM family protein phosphatase
MLAFDVALLSERGGRKVNEDACGHWQSEQGLCCVLADGAGGHGGGDVASRIAVRELIGRFAETPTTHAEILGTMLREVNVALLDERVPGTARQDMHSTVICLVIDSASRRAHWAHTGDSRLYWLRDGRVLARTRDHSLVQSLVDAGLLAPDLIRGHPQRSELRSALGVAHDQLVVDTADSVEPIEPGDAFLLCSDGLWEHLPDELIASRQAEAGSARDWLDALRIDLARATADKPDHDNFTALAVWAHAASDAGDPPD